MKRLVPIAALAVLACAAPASASALRAGPGTAQGLTVTGGSAYAILATDERNGPFTLVRSDGDTITTSRRFGTGDSIFPDVAASRSGRVQVLWGRSISAGQSYLVASLSGEESPLGSGTGPGRLLVGEDGPEVAYPDRDGNAALAGRPLTFDGPFRRHLPLDAEEGYVLDMAQTRQVTELRVLGEDAPRQAVAVAGGRRTLAGTLTVAGGRIHVAYMRRGRAYLATAAAERDARWSVTRLPGPGGGNGAAAVTRSRGRTVVAYAQAGEIYVHDGRLRRLTFTRAGDADALVAADPDSGELYVAWTSRVGDEYVAMVERLG